MQSKVNLSTEKVKGEWSIGELNNFLIRNEVHENCNYIDLIGDRGLNK